MTLHDTVHMQERYLFCKNEILGRLCELSSAFSWLTS